ncbi:hypothetical protein ACETU7_13785 [Rhodococcus sp. 3Y1]
MVSAAGAELVALNNILAIDGSNDTVRTLSNSAQNRINALGSTPSTSPLGSRVGTDLKSGNDQYKSLTDTTVTEFGDTVTAESNAARTAALRDTAIVLGAVLLALAIALVISRSLIDPIRRLRFAALQAARRGLPTRSNEFAQVPVSTTSTSPVYRSAPTRKSASLHARWTTCTVRPSRWPASRPPCGARSTTCSKRCRGVTSPSSTSNSV